MVFTVNTVQNRSMTMNTGVKYSIGIEVGNMVSAYTSVRINGLENRVQCFNSLAIKAAFIPEMHPINHPKKKPINQPNKQPFQLLTYSGGGGLVSKCSSVAVGAGGGAIPAGVGKAVAAGAGARFLRTPFWLGLFWGRLMVLMLVARNSEFKGMITGWEESGRQ
jgi:hypothetical protein